MKAFGQFAPEETKAFLKIGIPKKVPSKTILFEEGQAFDRLYFVQSGIVRAYRVIDGEDYTYFFFSDHDFAVDFQSFLTDTISSLFFETLTDTSLVVFSKRDIYQLYERFPRFEKLGRAMAENAYLSAAERLKQYQTDSLKVRYSKLISKNPSFVQAVPQHYIASYLGVKPQSLSRIRAEISGKKY